MATAIPYIANPHVSNDPARVSVSLDAALQIGAMAKVLKNMSADGEIDAMVVESCANRISLLVDSICQLLDDPQHEIDPVLYVVHGSRLSTRQTTAD